MIDPFCRKPCDEPGGCDLYCARRKDVEHEWHRCTPHLRSDVLGRLEVLEKRVVRLEAGR